MTKTLVIRSSANGEKSVTNALIDRYLAALPAHHPDTQVTERDLDRDPVPHVNSATLAGIGRPAPETPSSQGARDLSNALIAELAAADTLVLGIPMYNFGMPTTLKAWFDHVLRAGATFRYTVSGPEGLVPGRRAILVGARAGAYPNGPDYQIAHARTMLNFIGITDIEVVLAEGLAKGEPVAGAAMADAQAAIDKLAACATAGPSLRV